MRCLCTIPVRCFIMNCEFFFILFIFCGAPRVRTLISGISHRRMFPILPKHHFVWDIVGRYLISSLPNSFCSNKFYLKNSFFKPHICFQLPRRSLSTVRVAVFEPTQSSNSRFTVCPPTLRLRRTHICCDLQTWTEIFHLMRVACCWLHQVAFME